MLSLYTKSKWVGLVFSAYAPIYGGWNPIRPEYAIGLPLLSCNPRPTCPAPEGRVVPRVVVGESDIAQSGEIMIPDNRRDVTKFDALHRYPSSTRTFIPLYNQQRFSLLKI